MMCTLSVRTLIPPYRLIELDEALNSFSNYLISIKVPVKDFVTLLSLHVPTNTNKNNPKVFKHLAFYLYF